MFYRKICFIVLIYLVFFSFEAKSQWIKFEGLNDNKIRAIAIQDEDIFVGVYSNENFFVSEDGGETWTLFNEGITPVPVLDILLKDQYVFISTEGSGVYRMSDFVNTWTKVHSIGYKLLLKDDDIFAGSNHGVYRSLDNGTTWIQADSGLSRPPNTNVQSFTHLGDSIFVGTWGDGVFFSVDNGDYWQQMNDGLNSLFVWSFATMDSTIFVGTLGGVYRRELTDTDWQEVNEGLTDNRIYDLTVSGDNLFAGTRQGVFFSTNKGTDWQGSNIGLPDTTVWSVETNNDFIYAGTEIGLFKRLLSDIITSINWYRKADIPVSGRVEAVGFSVNEKGYISTGWDGSFKKDLWEFDPSSNTWTQKTDFGGGPRGDAIGFSIGNKAYIGTGFNGSVIKDFWEYDPETNSWTQKADLGGEARRSAIGFSIDGKGYIGLGRSNSFFTDFWEYNPETDSWTQKADFPGDLRDQALGFSIENKGYVGFGLTGAELPLDSPLISRLSSNSINWSRQGELSRALARSMFRMSPWQLLIEGTS